MLYESYTYSSAQQYVNVNGGLHKSLNTLDAGFSLSLTHTHTAHEVENNGNAAVC